MPQEGEPRLPAAGKDVTGGHFPVRIQIVLGLVVPLHELAGNAALPEEARVHDGLRAESGREPADHEHAVAHVLWKARCSRRKESAG